MLFAGSTVVIALCSLALADIPLVTSMGFAAAIVVLIAMAAALTLLPAVLGVLGGRIDSLKIPFLHLAHDRPHGWARWAHGVGEHAWPAMIAAVAVLVVLALPTSTSSWERRTTASCRRGPRRATPTTC